jgi:hypothetical protein
MKIAFRSSESSPESLSDWLTLGKGFLKAVLIVLVIYLTVSLGTLLSGTDALVPSAKYVECMIIYGFGCCFDRAYVALLRSKVRDLAQRSNL